MNNIWHFPSEAPAYCFQCVFYNTASNEYHFGQYSPVFKHFRSGNAGWEHEEVQKFAFAKDIIACLDELDRTRKALDVAKDTIRHADWFFDGDYNVDAKTMHNEIKCAIKGITALEQKDK